MPTLWGRNGVDWQQRVDFDRLRKERIAKANAMMEKHGIGAAIIYGWDNRRYLGAPWNHPYARHLPFECAIIIKGKGFPFVHVMKNLDDKQVALDAPWLEGRINAVDMLDHFAVNRMLTGNYADEVWKRNAQYVKSLLKEHGVADQPLGIDFTGMNFVYALQNEGFKLKDANACFAEARMVKTDDEIELMRQASTLNEAGYGAVMAEFRPGMRENDAQGIMAKAIYQAGAEYIEGWVVASGLRASPRSFNWSDKVVRPGELLQLEACHVTYCGYKVCYDRTFVVGAKPTDIQKEVYGCCVEMQHHMAETIKPGVTTHDVARIRRMPAPALKNLDDVRKFRAGWKNHFGGIGITWWDYPQLSLQEPEIVLEKNMVIAYHAVYSVDGVAGCTVENTYRVTEDGNERMTMLPYDEIPVIAG